MDLLIRLVRVALLVLIAMTVLTSIAGIAHQQTGGVEKLVLVGIIVALFWVAARITTKAEELRARLRTR